MTERWVETGTVTEKITNTMTKATWLSSISEMTGLEIPSTDNYIF